MISIRTIDKLPLKPGSRVFHRVDYNVPLEGTRITDATRIEETLPTLKLLRDRRAALVIASPPGQEIRTHVRTYSKLIVQPIAKELIVSSATKQFICTIAPIQCIDIVAAIEHIVTLVPKQQIESHPSR